MSDQVRYWIDGQLEMRDPKAPECYVDPDFGGAGEGAVRWDHDCVNMEGNRFRCESVLRTDKYPRLNADYPEWQVLSVDPLTISPSILCLSPFNCNTHGFFTEGVWIPV